MAKPASLIQLSVVTALDKIGKTNGTKLPECEIPSTATTNEQINLFQAEREAIHELAVAAQIQSYAETRNRKAKEAVNKMFPEIASLKPGSTTAINRGNCTVMIERRLPSARLDSAMLVSALAKRGWTTEDIEKLISESSKETAPATYYKSSVS